MPQRLVPTSHSPRRAVLRLEALEDRRVPSLFGLISDVAGQAPGLATLGQGKPVAPEPATVGAVKGADSGLLGPVLGSVTAAASSRSLGVDVNVSVGLGRQQLLDVAIQANVGGAGAPGLQLNLGVGLPLGASAGLTVNTGASPGGDTLAVPPLPAISLGLSAGASAGAPLIPGARLDAAVKSDGGAALTAGAGGAVLSTVARPVDGPGALFLRQRVNFTSAEAGEPVGGPQALTTVAPSPTVSFLLPAGNHSPSAAATAGGAGAVLVIPATLEAQRNEGEDGAGAQEVAAPEAQASDAALPPPRAPAAPARFESGLAWEEEGTAPAPEGTGPVTDFTPEQASEQPAGVAVWLGPAVSEVEGWPVYWRLAPWLAGLAGAAGVEVMRRRRAAAARAAGLPADEVLWGPLWPGAEV
jgi:hypothetical protein